MHPILLKKNIFMIPIIISTSGQKGGNVRFAHAINDIMLHMKQRDDTYVTLFVDYYGIKGDWPGLESAKTQKIPVKIAKIINDDTRKAVYSQLHDYGSSRRFVPNIAVHEFEALLFSDAKEIACQLGIKEKLVEAILKECGEPETINNSSMTAPYKRLEKLYDRYKKTITGITIAKAIGIIKMREKCPVFNNWLNIFEKKLEAAHGKA